MDQAQRGLWLMPESVNYVAAKATYIRLLLGQNGGFSALAP